MFCNASDFEVNLIFFLTKNRFWWKFCFQKITFGSFYTKKRQFLQLRVFSKTNKCLQKWKKNSYPTKILEENLIFKQIFYKASDSSQTFQNKWVFSQFYTTRVILYRKFYSLSDFETSFCHTSGFERKF